MGADTDSKVQSGGTVKTGGLAKARNRSSGTLSQATETATSPGRPRWVAAQLSRLVGV